MDVGIGTRNARIDTIVQWIAPRGRGAIVDVRNEPGVRQQRRCDRRDFLRTTLVAGGAGLRGELPGRYLHRLVTGGIGHNLPREAPRAFADVVVDVAG